MRSYVPAFLAIAFTALGSLFAQTYSVVDLGPGSANDVNNLGHVVGDSAGFGFRWDGTNRVSLGGFRINGSPVVPARGRALAINDSGYIAAAIDFGSTETAYGCVVHAGTNSAVPLPFTTGIDDSGNILGYDDRTQGITIGRFPPTRGYYLGEAAPLSRFYAINSHGVIAGSAASVTEDSLDTTADPPRACYFTNSTVVYVDTRPVPTTRLHWTAVDGAQYRMSDALALNDAGVIVGWFRAADEGPRRAFRYAGSAMVDIGTLGGASSVARAVNASGAIVGESTLGDGSTHAFIYQDGTMQDLNSVAPVAGWEFLSANAINDNGTIVGQARHQGELKAYVLTPGLATPPPVITQHPAGIRIAAGAPWLLSASVSGASPLTFQWQHGGTNIPGATNLAFQITAVTPATVGTYRLLATNPGGTASSSNAVVELLGVSDYQITDLGTGVANDINNLGVVVGTSGDFGFIADGNQRRTLTNLLYNTVTVGGTTYYDFGRRSTATAINDAGQVGGFVWMVTSRDFDYEGSAYLLTGDTNSSTMFYGQRASVYAISEDGSLLGQSVRMSGEAYGFSLGPLAFYSESMFPADINRPGTVAGTTITYANNGANHQRMRAAILTNGVITIIDPRALPELFVDHAVNSDERNHWSDAYGINDSGVVVGAMLTHVGGPRHAFRYDGGAFEDLGTLGGTNSAARKVNSAGLIVGESLTANGRTHAFIYRDGLMNDLNSLLPPGSGMELISANAINDQGEIVGEAIFEGQSHGYVLSPSGLVNPPRIAAQPAGGRLSIGDSLTLSVTATGTLPFAYQWTLNGTNIANATNATYVISSATAADAGDYRVFVTNEGGTTPSTGTRVDVLDPELLAVRLFGLQITGSIGATYRVEFRPSAGVSTWTALTNVTLVTSPQLWVDLQSVENAHRLYRAVRLP